MVLKLDELVGIYFVLKNNSFPKSTKTNSKPITNKIIIIVVNPLMLKLKPFNKSFFFIFKFDFSLFRIENKNVPKIKEIIIDVNTSMVL